MAAAAPAPSAKKRSRSEVVLKGRKSLKANLQKSQDIPATILEFQHAHDLGSAKCDALTELLRLTGMSRADVHKQLLESLTNELTDRIPTLSKPRQDDLLRKTFQFLERDVKELKMVPLALLKRRSDIPAAVFMTKRRYGSQKSPKLPNTKKLENALPPRRDRTHTHTHTH